MQRFNAMTDSKGWKNADYSLLYLFLAERRNDVLRKKAS